MPDSNDETLPRRKRAVLPLLPDPPTALKGEPKATASAAADAEAWAALREKLPDSFPLTKGDTAAGALTRNLLRIETGFTFTAQPLDDDFSELHVEPLLDQAADLLDRGVRDRAAYDDLAARAMLLSLDVNEFAEFDQIQASEQANGCYGVAFAQSHAEWIASAASAAGFANAAQFAQDTAAQQYYGAGALKGVENSQYAAWLTGQTASKDPNALDPISLTPFGYGMTATISTHAETVAAKQARRQMEIEDASLFLQEQQAAAASDSLSQRLPGLKARSDWDYKNQFFAKWRADVARKYGIVKAAAAAAPNGVLNYGKRLDAIRTRFQSDFRNALARLRRVARGMDLLFGYDVPLPADEQSIDYFDDCLLWARQAIDWLIRFARREQSLVLPVSLRQQLGDQAWFAGLQTRQWTFPLSQMAFPGFAHVRLRGLAATTVSKETTGAILWGMSVRAPVSGAVVHLSSQKRTLDQSRVPPCELGRVTTRVGTRIADVVGASALHNASPFGEWQVFLKSSTWPGQPQHDVDDIQLDLHLSFRRAVS